MKVFYVEDEPLIAMETEDILRDAGFSDIDIHHTFDGAMEAVEGKTYDLAVMDMNLNGKLSAPLIDKLAERNVIVIVTTGYNSADEHNAWKGLTTLHKPFSAKQLTDAIDNAIRLRA